ncbi:MAG: hypothetical protein ACRD07_21930 [Acidimicrobiales bacterium]
MSETSALASSPEQPPVRQTRLRDFLSSIDKTKAALGLLALIIYGVVRVAHDAFYDSLGITAEDIGLGYSIIVSRAVLYFVYYSAFGVIAVIVAAVVIDLIAVFIRLVAVGSRWVSRRGHTESTSEGSMKTGFFRAPPNLLDILGLPVVIVIAMIPGIVGIYAPDAVPTLLGLFELEPTVFTLSLAAAVLMVIALYFAVRSLPYMVKLIDSGLKGPSTLLVAMIFATLAVLSYGLANLRGTNLAQHLRQGERVRPHNFDVLGVRADPVCLIPAATATRVIADRPFMYLGERSGTLFLYEWGARDSHGRVIRVPAKDVTVQEAVGPDRKKGPWLC